MCAKEELLQRVNRKIGKGYTQLSAMSGGDLNETFALSGGDQPELILSLLPASRSAAQVHFHFEVLIRLSKSGVPVPEPFSTLEAKADADLQRLSYLGQERPFILTLRGSGRVSKYWSASQFPALQAAVQKLAHSARSMQLEFQPVREMHRSARSLRSLGKTFLHRKQVWQYALNSLEAWEASLTLPTGLIHGDLCPKNILIARDPHGQGSSQATIVDFDNAHVGWSMLDPVYAGFHAALVRKPVLASPAPLVQKSPCFDRSVYEAFIQPFRTNWNDLEKRQEEGVLALASLLTLVHAHEVGADVSALFDLFMARWQSFFDRSDRGQQALDCKSASLCGGCPLFQLNAAEEKSFKLKRVNSLFEDITSSVPTSYDASPAHFGYRNRIRLRVDNGLVKFFNPDKSQECAVLEPRLGALLRRVIRRTRGRESFYRQFRHLELRAPDLDGKLAIHWSLREQPDSFAPLLKELQARFPDVLHALTQFDPQTKRSIGSEDPANVALQRFPAGATYQYVPVTEFVQVNHETNQRLIERVIQLGSQLGLKKGRALDLFGGSGNYALPLSQEFPLLEIMSIEWTPLAAQSLARAAEEQDLKVRALTADVQGWLIEKVQQKLSSDADDLELVIVNPPRRGLSEGCEPLIGLQPKAILEIACKPESLRRDLTLFLDAGYHLVALQVFNMFPHTAHIETLALLIRDEDRAAEFLRSNEERN